MFNNKLFGSPKSRYEQLEHDSSQMTSFLHPQITSTPIGPPQHSIHQHTPRPLLVASRKFVGPKRYALSTNGSNGAAYNYKTKNPPGPLLASTPYDVNVSTYLDSKSPGYTSRIVQYKNEQQNYTHQEKYDGPGLFPIVHLFKKDPPVLSPKSKNVTVRIGTPEINKNYSQEHNRLLLEGIVHNNSLGKEQNQNDVSTRSVLDALKEISRKRIHSTESYELAEGSIKKLRQDCMNSENGINKRDRIDSQSSDTSSSPGASSAKKVCYIDPITASKTSSMLYLKETREERKKLYKKLQEIEDPVNRKHFNNVETQTATNKTENKSDCTVGTSTSDKDANNDLENSQDIFEKPKHFEEKSLEVIKKNRLFAMVNALTREEIPRIPSDFRRKISTSDEPISSPMSSGDQPLSIISPKNKPKSPKHVSFDLPETISNKETVTTSNNLLTSSSSSVTFALNGNIPSSSSTPQLTDKPKDSISENNKTTTIVSSSAAFSFGTSSTATLTQNKVSFFPTPASIAPASSTPANSISAISAPVSSITASSTSTSGAPASELPKPSIGGFKFDLKAPISSASASVTPALQFTIPEKQTNVEHKPASTMNSAIISSSVPQFNFSASPSNAVKLPSNNIQVSTPSNNTILGKTTSGFVSSKPNEIINSTSIITSSINNIVQKTTSTSLNFNSFATTSPSFTFGNKTNTSIANGITSSTPSSSAFGNSTLKSPELPKSSSVSFNAPSFGLPSNVSLPIVSSNTSANNSINSQESKPMFGSITSPTTLTGSIVSSSSFTSSVSPFNVSSTKTTNANAMFGNNTTKSGFTSTFPTATTTANSVFGNPTITLNNTSTNVFGNSSMPTSVGNPSGFGVSSASSFGQNPSNQVLTSTSSMFGTTSSTPFGATTTTTPGFNFTASKPAFCTANTSGFGAPPVNSVAANNSGFGTNSASSLPNSSGFGSANNTSFGTTTGSTFGTPSFGNNSATPTFGAPITTATSTFGTNSVPSMFGAPTTTASGFNFGSNTSTFSTQKEDKPYGTSNFGISNNNPPFGGSSFGNSTPFGQNSTPNNGFGQTTTASSGFGSSAPTFGTANTSNPLFSTSTTSSTFGTTTPSIFGGASSGFNTATSNSAGIFGNSTSTFGNTNTNNNPTGFGTTSTTAFGSSNATANVGNSSTFGSNNNTFGTAVPGNNPFGSSNTANPFGNNNPSNNTSGFGTGFSSPAAAPFGNNNPAPTFGSPTPGQSGFASGSSTNSGVFTFGSPASQTNSSGVFSFGASEPPKTFNFSANSSNAGNSALQFGANNNNPGAGGFGAPNPFAQQNTGQPNMFTIGSGTQSRGRAHIRPKRRN